MEQEEYEKVDGDFNEIDGTKGDVGERFQNSLQRILLTPREPKPTQRHVIFRTKCTIQKKI